MAALVAAGIVGLECLAVDGVRVRAAAFGGTLSATRLPDGGFHVRADLPLAGAE